ncbi:MAG: hypothetical protein LBI28_12635 [Treponema sp.]|jgi:hypothetical protein|nr:hypothetical protein [Treponema sp.]
MSDNKYKLFRNYMVNELGISREDIKEWTMQAVKETVEKELRGIEVNKKAEEVAERIVNRNISNYAFQKEVVAEAVTNLINDLVKIRIELRGDQR